MPASNIKVFLRVRPCAKPSPNVQTNLEQGSLTFELDRQSLDGEVNNVKTTHAFRFDGILGMQVSQEEVLNIIGKPVIDDVLNGVNGTIFAYGQTGSGKTFTMTGGAQRYADRGLIPRTLAYMFECFRKSQTRYKMYISYMEIYDDKGYDLMRENNSSTKLEDLPKVILREDDDGNSHLRNLSVNAAATEEDALNLLFEGDTNRAVAETPMNDASTRSHCLFIIWVESTTPGSDVVRRSKLHLVDLAGSERVSQTGVEGKLLKEAKAINLSLHYLERVIVALHARAKGEQRHVPYRDSMMTSVLRDSLGGNCRTTMVACIAMEPSNIPESISTCRFAQRVAQIQNNAKVNEELDPTLLIARLKREVLELKQEVLIARGSADGRGEEPLTAEDVEQCRALVLQYVSRVADPNEPFVCGSVERLRTSFRLLRDLCNGASISSSVAGGTGRADPAAQVLLEAEAKKLRLEIAQRDQEISVIMQMVSKQRNTEGQPFIRSTPAAGAPGGATGGPPPREFLDGSNAAFARPAATQDKLRPVEAERPARAASSATAAESLSAERLPSAPRSAPSAPPRARAQPRPGERDAPPAALPPSADAATLLLDQEKAFQVFRQSVYRPPESFEENKNLLKERIAQAKGIGDEANAIRAGINQAKTRLERLRTERAMTAAGYDDAPPSEDGPEEVAEVQEIDRLKTAYRETTAELRRVKSEVEMIQRLLEQNRTRMQKEFEAWFAALRKQAKLDALDEETKRELYEKVTAVSGTPMAGTVTLAASKRPDNLQQAAAFAATPRPLPLALKSKTLTGDTRTDDDIAAYYAAMGELAARN